MAVLVVLVVVSNVDIGGSGNRRKGNDCGGDDADSGNSAGQ